jgi:hypothetical protein
MVQPPFGEPGVCPMIVLISYTTNQFLIGGFFSTTSFRLSSRGLNLGTISISKIKDSVPRKLAVAASLQRLSVSVRHKKRPGQSDEAYKQVKQGKQA